MMKTARTRILDLRGMAVLPTLVGLAVSSLSAVPAALGQTTFFEVGEARGIGAFEHAPGFTAGLAAADFDADGDVDLFVPAGAGYPGRLYRNTGDGYFEDVAERWGVAGLGNDRAALWLDYDGDADLDLLVAGDRFVQRGASGLSSLRLLRRDADAFADVTYEAGLLGVLNGSATVSKTHVGGLAAADADGDGDLDLVVTFWQGFLFYFRNRGDGTFEDATAAAQLDAPFETYWQPVFADFDRDGCQDLFVAVDFHDNRMFHNQCDGTFIDVGVALGMGNPEQNDMGVAVGDIDEDGDLDLFVSNVFSGPDRRNHLYRNDASAGQLAFTEVAIQAGVEASGWAWGTTFADADRDGRDDLLVTNGFGGENDPSRLFQRLPGTTPLFRDIASETGFDDRCWGSALIAADLDRDHDLDVVQACVGGPLRVLDNRPGADTHGLTVRPRMRAGGNRFAIGAVVEVAIAGRAQVRPILAGSSMVGQEPAEAVFGLGEAIVADRVSVRWPDGRLSVIGGVLADRILDLDDGTIFADGFEMGSSAAWSATAP